MLPLLGLTDMTCTCYVMCVCVLECDPHDIGITVSYYFVLHFFCTQWQICFSACLLLCVFLHRLMIPNKVETGRGLFT